MKKVLISLMFAFFATSLFAQHFTVAPTTFEGRGTELLGEAMTQDRHYVVGTDQALQVPMIWNTQTNELIEIMQVDSVFSEEEGWSYVPMTGTFHGVNNSGIAVGSITTADYVSHPIMARCDGNGEYTILATNEGEAGCEAYGISDDGVIVGFYFSEDWTTYGCIWTENGTVRTDLPRPTADQVNFPVEYVSARHISDNGNTILGYAQDDNTGAWVALAWVRQNGEYVVRVLSNEYFQTYYYDQEGNLVQNGNNPFYEFSPAAVSANGEWLALTVIDSYDLSDWDADATARAARLNLVTNQFEVLRLDFEHEANEVFGIADNGTCVGRLSGYFNPMTGDQPVDGMVWFANSDTCYYVASLYPEEEYAANMIASSLSSITADGSYVMGYASSNSGEWTAFVMEMPEGGSTESVEEVETNVALYPNPATTQVNVTVNGEIRSYSVINAMGQVVLSRNGINASNVAINTQNLASGVYFVNVVTDNGQASKRISIVR